MLTLTNIQMPELDLKIDFNLQPIRFFALE